MSLIVEPDDGIGPVVSAIQRAKKSIDIGIFRLDRGDIAKALRTAVGRGVQVRTLIAHTNRGGDKRLRKLELRLLEAGVTVSRTADDLVRYHGKYLIIDQASLWILGFNSTHLDIFRSRSFGIMTTNRALVHEALSLFETDSNREAFRSRVPDLIVSPENSRGRLTALIKAAKSQLLIYDPKVTDPSMLRLLQERVKSGVDVRVIGKVTTRGEGLATAKLQKLRLHVRAIVRDGTEAFVGSQSLRVLELDRRREVGIIVRDRRIAKQLQVVFESDWEQAKPSSKDKKSDEDGDAATAK